MIATVVLILRLLLSIALYAFLGWALWTLLQELKQQGDKLSAQKTPVLSLNIQMEHGRQAVRSFTQSEIMIGRDTNCDVSIIDDALSAHHARLTYHHGQWWLEDLHSTNGTLLNNQKLATAAVIITGDEFKCGHTLFDVHVEENGAASPKAIQ
jgi:pSer/pThr/pTyr-binding forkhead associated (FHA) protein